MPRPRLNDPVGESDNPRTVSDPTRKRAGLEEFQRRLAYVTRSYRFGLAMLADDRAFNASLRKLKRSLARKRKARRRGDRAHPQIEAVITKFARDHARERTGLSDADVTQVDANAGAQKAADVLQSRKGRPSKALLRYHVEGLMVLLQEFSGRPVKLTLYKDNIYDPQPTNSNGRILLMVCQEFEPGTTATALASMVKAARRKYAKKPMRFRDFFPLYGVSDDGKGGMASSKTGYKVVGFQPNIPIYFP